MLNCFENIVKKVLLPFRALCAIWTGVSNIWPTAQKQPARGSGLALRWSEVGILGVGGTPKTSYFTMNPTCPVCPLGAPSWKECWKKPTMHTVKYKSSSSMSGRSSSIVGGRHSKGEETTREIPDWELSASGITTTVADLTMWRPQGRLGFFY